MTIGILQLSAIHLQHITTHAEETYPEECCGILLGQWHRSSFPPAKTVTQVWAVENAWNDEAAAVMATVVATAVPGSPTNAAKTERYWIDPKELLAAQRYAREHHIEVIGIYHSHPDHAALPSESDRALAWSSYSYLIVSVQSGSVKDILCWQLDDQHQFRSQEIMIL